MNTANHISQDDLALFALQLLSEDETGAALEHLQHCADCRQDLGAFQGDLALYAMASDMHEPPARARERLLRQVSEEGRVAPVAERPKNVLPFEPKSSKRRPRNSFVTWGGWAIAAGFAVAAGLQMHQRRQLQSELASEHAQLSRAQESVSASQTALSPLTDPTALNIALQQPDAKAPETPHTPTGHAAYLPDRGALVFVATDLQPLKPYKVYELWLLPAEKGGAPIPAVSFRPDANGNADVVLPTGPRLLSVKGFGVTMEDDKTPPKQPTLPILLMGSSKT